MVETTSKAQTALSKELTEDETKFHEMVSVQVC